uniref:Uncharacterized protein n=1 Tax=Cyclopterus lumpus TaxID=8103 RepID=A0A8C2XNA8_CYCLU
MYNANLLLEMYNLTTYSGIKMKQPAEPLRLTHHFGNTQLLCSYSKRTLRLEDRDPVMEKKESSRPCVLPCRLFKIFLQPLRILSSLRTHTQINQCIPSSSGSLHFNSTVEQSTTSSSGAGCFCMKSMFSRISSMQPCCLIRSMALLGPIPLMVPQ